MAKIVNGIIVKDFIKGFFCLDAECFGPQVLIELGLDEETIPFDVEEFLQNRSVVIKGNLGYDAEVSFFSTDKAFEFQAKYKNKTKKTSLYKEWDYEDIDMIMHLESEAVGVCVSEVMYQLMY